MPFGASLQMRASEVRCACSGWAPVFALGAEAVSIADSVQARGVRGRAVDGGIGRLAVEISSARLRPSKLWTGLGAPGGGQPQWSDRASPAFRGW
jgi:hypothetical protein